MVKIIPVVDRDGLNVKVMILSLDVDKGVDVYKAVEAACTEYCKTEEGKRTYEGNCNSFNWGDFETYVPDEICRKHGVRKIDSFMCEDEIDFNQQLVDEDEIFPEEDE
jgi:hypothetical protein